MAGNAQRGSLLCSLADPATGKALPVAGGRLVRAASRERRRYGALGNMVVFSPRLNRRVETRFVRGVLVSRLAFFVPLHRARFNGRPKTPAPSLMRLVSRPVAKWHVSSRKARLFRLRSRAFVMHASAALAGTMRGRHFQRPHSGLGAITTYRARGALCHRRKTRSPRQPCESSAVRQRAM